ncbi:MAG: DUF3276 family protein [Candidatus Saccharibacteria bacterium]
MQEFSAPLFSTKVSSGRRTFFFDVKATKEDKPFLKITESSVKDGEKKRINLMVFDSEIPEFVAALSQAADFASQHNKANS